MSLIVEIPEKIEVMRWPLATKVAAPPPVKLWWCRMSETLTIDSSGLLGRPSELVISSWDDGLNSHFGDADEENTLPTMGDWIVSGDAGEVLNAWRATIPPDVLQACSKTQGLQSRLLWLARRSERFRSVLVSNPLLAWAVVLHHRDVAVDTFPLSLFDLPQHQLLGAIGLPVSRSKVRMLRRLRDCSLNRSGLLRLLELMQAPVHDKFFAHLKLITGAELILIEKHPWITRCKAQRLLPALLDRDHLRLFEDSARMAADLSALRKCGSVDRLRRLHDRLVERTNRETMQNRYRRDADGRLLSLPKAPFGGELTLNSSALIDHPIDVVHIDTQDTLFTEARAMRHCLASYVDRILRGEYLAFAMTAPTRLSIGVIKTRQGNWQIDQVKGRGNREPSAEEWARVEQWWGVATRGEP